MADPARLRFITDGTVTLEDVRGKLADQGELVRGRPGEAARFVPDDPGFPTTYFHDDGIIELDPASAERLRLNEYVQRLSSWLGVRLQQLDGR